MYLKALEIVGFKSFASKTRLEFEPGLTAIVGPNGCGKSNVSDAIRWVLGEQRARALRGAKMEDIIFNGTEERKALGMAEVSLTLAECSKTLGLEYDEICVTRRVFRSGESGYFLNRKACRLKDIQRLFMDTGVGTDSYSILEQGKIDQILSSHPEDRRAVFEEASGITKFKADRAEALRKLKQTEDNLLRLADVVLEVKRQIGSMQRQVSKARRYKALSEELREYDLYVTHEKLQELAQQMNACTGELQSLERRANEQQEKVRSAEADTTKSRMALTELEQQIGTDMEKLSALRSELERTTQLGLLNQDRIQELKQLAQRNKTEIEETQSQTEQLKADLKTMESDLAKAAADRLSAETAFKKASEQEQDIEQQYTQLRTDTIALRNQLLNTEKQLDQQRNALSLLEEKDQNSLMKRERFSAEKEELERSVTEFNKRRTDTEKQIKILGKQVADLAGKLNQLSQQRADCRTAISETTRAQNDQQKTLSARRAQLEMLSAENTRQEGFPAGARQLMELPKTIPFEHNDVIGPLAEQLNIAPEMQLALEAVLRPCLDAIVVRTPESARQILGWLKDQEAGSARLLCVDGPESHLHDQLPGRPFIELLRYSDRIAPLIKRLFGPIGLIETAEELPEKLPPGTIAVTRSGAMYAASGDAEIWMPGKKVRTPVARNQLRERLEQETQTIESKLPELKQKLEGLRIKETDLGRVIESVQQEMETARRELALQEGEQQVLHRQTSAANERISKLESELKILLEQKNRSGNDHENLKLDLQKGIEQQNQLRDLISKKNHSLEKQEKVRNQAMEATAELRMVHAQKQQAFELIESKHQPLTLRIKELKVFTEKRTSERATYQQRIEKLHTEIQEAQTHIAPLEKQIQVAEKTLAQDREEREALLEKQKHAEETLRQLRQALGGSLNQKSGFEVRKAEARMRYDSALERVIEAYKTSKEELQHVEPPTSKTGEPLTREQMENRIAEIRTKLDSIGPVNLVAIEEFSELEERFTFLNQQQDDLLNAKKQLMEMIREINRTTTEMFRQTFDAVNSHFQEMFKNLFGGGSAQLKLMDEEDLLESGIEIIARPPGKKLQSISLLSGGERTMTAVALLFSLFTVKPSPFCVLDELDAALDDANIHRFVDTLKSFLDRSQFIIITHSRQTIAAADAIYGVTMQKRGISSIVSMKFADYHEA